MKRTIIIIVFALALVFGLIACESKTQYTVQFDTLCDIAVQSQKVQHGEKIIRPEGIERENYQFDGWYASRDYNEEDKWSFIGYTVTNSMTLYAKWTALPTPGLYYDLIDDNSYEVSLGDALYFGHSDIVIASQYNGLPVTKIANRAFNVSGLTTIIIPNSIIDIGKEAFMGCTGLTNIEIPNSVKNIGDGAFTNCTGLTYIEIPSSVKNIGDGAFINCTNLKSIFIPDSVRSIGDNAFEYCINLESITIPDSVKYIGSNAFISCKLTIYIEFNPVDGWNASWNFENRPVVLGCTLSGDRSYVLHFIKVEGRIINPQNYSINAPFRYGYSFVGWSGSSSNRGEVDFTAEDIETARDNIKLSSIWVKL